jgi:hypothetical protein
MRFRLRVARKHLDEIEIAADPPADGNRRTFTETRAAVT